MEPVGPGFSGNRQPFSVLGQVAIWVCALDAAKRFYGGILRVKLRMEIPGQGLFLAKKALVTPLAAPRMERNRFGLESP